MVRRVKTFWDNLDQSVKRVSGFVGAIAVIVGVSVSAYAWASNKIVQVIDDRVGDLQTQVMTANQKADSYAEETRLSLARNDLMNLVADYPDNVNDILKAAEHYFIDLDGNYVAEQAFLDWAAKKNIDITYIQIKLGAKHD